jgi:hypothetical protein
MPKHRKLRLEDLADLSQELKAQQQQQPRPEEISQPNPNDILSWPDGGWCYRYESATYLVNRSHDYRVIKTHDPEWERVIGTA